MGSPSGSAAASRSALSEIPHGVESVSASADPRTQDSGTELSSPVEGRETVPAPPVVAMADPVGDDATAPEATHAGDTTGELEVRTESGPPEPGLPASAARVIAILVSHDGAAYLPRTLAAVEAQIRPPDVLVGVDTGSRDGSPDLLAATTRRTLRLARRTSFGDAVSAALAALDADLMDPAPDPEPMPDPSAAPADAGGAEGAGDAPPAVVEWLWLLHDDAAPAPDALARLLQAVDAAPSVGIAGCKQVAWDDDRRLLDVGFTVSPLGKRVTGVDVDDVDQGQLDHRSDVLAVGTAGMLVRRQLWESLGGLDPALAHARDDLDLCRRAHLAGHRVIVVPQAVVSHAAATAGGLRGGGDASWARRDRKDAIHLRLAGTPWPLIPFAIAWIAGATVIRSLGRLVLKQPDQAGAEMAALAVVLLRPDTWWRAQRRTTAVRRLPRSAFRRLLADPRALLRQRRDAVSAYLLAQEEAWAAAHAAGRPASDPREERRVGALSDSADGGGPSAGALLALILLVGAAAGFVGARGLLRGTGEAVGPALLPMPDRAAQLWAVVTNSWRPVGLGRPAAGDPLDAALAVLATLFGGSTRAPVDLLLLGAIPLAAGSAWLAAAGLTGSRALRAWAALAWAAAPPLLGALAAGRLGAVLAHLLLPPAALAIARTTAATGSRPVPIRGRPSAKPRPRGSVASASVAGLLLTVILAGAPMLAVPCLLALLAVAVAAPARRGLWWVFTVPAVLLLPWWWAVVRHPVLLLAEAGGPSAPASVARNGIWHVVALGTDPAAWLVTAPGRTLTATVATLPAVLHVGPAIVVRVLAAGLAVPVLVLAVAGLLRRDRRAVAAATLWLVGISGLVVAALAPWLVAARVNGAERHAWPGPAVSLFLLGLLGAALCRADGAAGRLRTRSLGRRHAAAVALAGAAVLAPLLTLTAWSWQGWQVGAAHPAHPEDQRAAGRWVHRADPDVLPAVAAAEAESPAAIRTLVLRSVDGRVSWNLAGTGGPRTGVTSAETALMRDDLDADQVLPVVGGLLSGTGHDERAGLADLDVGSVLLLAGSDDAALAALDTSPGLVRVAAPGGSVLWRVQLDDSADGPTRPARVRVIGPDKNVLAALPSTESGEVRTRVTSGPSGRRLVFADRADPGWHAWLDGEELTATTYAGWAQAFQLPPRSGTLVVGYREPGQRWTDVARLAVAGVALLVAVPLPRRRPRLLPPSAQRGRTPGEEPDWPGPQRSDRAPGTLPSPDAWIAADEDERRPRTPAGVP